MNTLYWGVVLSGWILSNCLHGSVPLYSWKAINVIMLLLNIIFMISFAFPFATVELATKQKSGKVVIDWEYCFVYESLFRAKKMAFFTNHIELCWFLVFLLLDNVFYLHSYALRCAAVCFWWTISVLFWMFCQSSSVRSRPSVVVTLINS